MENVCVAKRSRHGASQAWRDARVVGRVENGGRFLSRRPLPHSHAACAVAPDDSVRGLVAPAAAPTATRLMRKQMPCLFGPHYCSQYIIDTPCSSWLLQSHADEGDVPFNDDGDVYLGIRLRSMVRYGYNAPSRQVPLISLDLYRRCRILCLTVSFSFFLPLSRFVRHYCRLPPFAISTTTHDA